MSTEKEHLAAVLALMGGPAQKAYSLGQLDTLKATGLPSSYNEVHVMERLGSGPRRTSLPSQTQQWRILVRSVGGAGATGFANAQEMRNRASALHESPLTVASQTYYIERALSDDPIAPDDGWWSGVSEFHY